MNSIKKLLLFCITLTYATETNHDLLMTQESLLSAEGMTITDEELELVYKDVEKTFVEAGHHEEAGSVRAEWAEVAESISRRRLGTSISRVPSISGKTPVLRRQNARNWDVDGGATGFCRANKNDRYGQCLKAFATVTTRLNNIDTFLKAQGGDLCFQPSHVSRNEDNAGDCTKIGKVSCDSSSWDAWKHDDACVVNIPGKCRDVNWSKILVWGQAGINIVCMLFTGGTAAPATAVTAKIMGVTTMMLAKQAAKNTMTRVFGGTLSKAAGLKIMQAAPNSLRANCMASIKIAAKHAAKNGNKAWYNFNDNMKSHIFKGGMTQALKEKLAEEIIWMHLIGEPAVLKSIVNDANVAAKAAWELAAVVDPTGISAILKYYKDRRDAECVFDDPPEVSEEDIKTLEGFAGAVDLYEAVDSDSICSTIENNADLTNAAKGSFNEQLGRRFDSPQGCAQSKAMSKKCSSGVFQHNPQTHECKCCSGTGVKADPNKKWNTYKMATQLEVCTWEESNDGVDLAGGEWNGSGGTSFDQCKANAEAAGVDYFAWTGQVYSGFCKVLKPSVTNPNLRTNQGYGYKLWHTSCPGCNERQSTLAENNFNDRGDTSLNWRSTYTYTLYNGYRVDLSGWTHTRGYAKGFLTNAANTSPQAIVSGLEPNADYSYTIYQYASSYAGQNGFTAPGASEVMTNTNTDEAPTASGTFISNENGQAVFSFRKISGHVHLSAISIANLCTTGVNGEDYCESQFLLRNEESCKASSCCHWNTWEDGEASFNGQGRCWSDIGTETCTDMSVGFCPVGYLLAFPGSPKGECQQDKANEVGVTATSRRACAAKCTAAGDTCYAFDFHPDSKKCYLNQKCDKQDEDQYLSCRKNKCPEGWEPTFGRSEDGECNHDGGTETNMGLDKTLEQCAAMCAAEVKCVAFDHDHRGACYLNSKCSKQDKGDGYLSCTRKIPEFCPDGYERRRGYSTKIIGDEDAHDALKRKAKQPYSRTNDKSKPVLDADVLRIPDYDALPSGHTALNVKDCAKKCNQSGCNAFAYSESSRYCYMFADPEPESSSQELDFMFCAKPMDVTRRLETLGYKKIGNGLCLNAGGGRPYAYYSDLLSMSECINFCEEETYCTGIAMTTTSHSNPNRCYMYGEKKAFSGKSNTYTWNKQHGTGLVMKSTGGNSAAQCWRNPDYKNAYSEECRDNQIIAASTGATFYRCFDKHKMYKCDNGNSCCCQSGYQMVGNGWTCTKCPYTVVTKSAAKKPRDNDQCVSKDYDGWKCESKYCRSYAKTYARCCPETCGIGVYTEAMCKNTNANGICRYPNSANSMKRHNYGMGTTYHWKKSKRNYECGDNSKEKQLRSANSEKECARACYDSPNCASFIYGSSSKQCWDEGIAGAHECNKWKYTTHYDFYQFYEGCHDMTPISSSESWYFGCDYCGSSESWDKLRANSHKCGYDPSYHCCDKGYEPNWEGKCVATERCGATCTIKLFYRDYEIDGDEVHKPSINDLDTCAEECLKDSKCFGFDFGKKTENGKCYHSTRNTQRYKKNTLYDSWLKVCYYESGNPGYFASSAEAESISNGSHFTFSKLVRFLAIIGMVFIAYKKCKKNSKYVTVPEPEEI